MPGPHTSDLVSTGLQWAIRVLKRAPRRLQSTLMFKEPQVWVRRQMKKSPEIHQAGIGTEGELFREEGPARGARCLDYWS